MTRQRKYKINGVNLDDPQHRWHLLRDSRAPFAAGTEINMIKVPAAHGVQLTGSTTRTHATLALLFHLQAPTHQQLRANRQTLINLLTSWTTNGLLTIEYDDGNLTTKNHGIVNNELAHEEYGAKEMTLPVTILLPDPFWEETTTKTINITNHQPTPLPQLANGGAPIHPTINIKTKGLITSATITCLNTGTQATWTGSTPNLHWNQWQAKQNASSQPDENLTFGIEAPPTLYPDNKGNYHIKIDVTANSTQTQIQLIAARRFQ